jgi:hypothetical protein
LGRHCLGIISITPEGSEPKDKKEVVRKMAEVKKEVTPKNGMVSGGETQSQIDAKMNRMLEDFKPLFVEERIQCQA